MPYWANELCGTVTPACRDAYITRPEQSKLDGPTPPYAYGAPTFDIAAATAAAALLLVVGAAGWTVWRFVVSGVAPTPIAVSVCASGCPVAGRPWADSNALIAARV